MVVGKPTFTGPHEYTGKGRRGAGLNRGHAIIVGASIAGLLAARVLADNFERVTLVERDLLPTRPEHRKGIPQGHHVHGLLSTGQRIISQLFPGILSNLISAGATACDATADFLWHH